MDKIRALVLAIPRRLSTSSYKRRTDNYEKDGADEEKASFLSLESAKKPSPLASKSSTPRWRKYFIGLLSAFVAAMLMIGIVVLLQLAQVRDMVASELPEHAGHTENAGAMGNEDNENGEAYKAVLLQNPLPGDYMMREPCGSTPEEATERGCRFDVASFCWLPDACYDGGLSEQFDNYRDWEWFLDPDKTQPLSRQQVMTGKYPEVFVRWGYHIRHCTAMWMKMHRALMGPGTSAIDSYIGNIHHTHHCGEMLLDREVDTEDLNTIILVKYPDCGLVKGNCGG
ncbi:hypothetical protein F5Y10DRAFT_266651 [Nemania abortiva]|nr:hypothetical protein F5Y10DRAFT_266651 [Nemania abortiva]